MMLEGKTALVFAAGGITGQVINVCAGAVVS